MDDLEGPEENNSPPVIIQMTVVLDSGNANIIFQAMEILSRAGVGLALDGVSTDISIFQPQHMDYVVEVDSDDGD